MRKIILLMLFCSTVILAACSQGEEDKQEYSGVIGSGKAVGYEFSVTKEQNTFSWKVGYKGDTSNIIESASNKGDLEKFMSSVNDSKVILAKLISSVLYFLIIIITTLTLYKRNRKMLKDGGVIITGLAGIAVYIAIGASFDLNSSLHDANYYYFALTN